MYAGHFLMWCWTYLSRHRYERQALDYIHQMLLLGGSREVLDTFVSSVLSSHERYPYDFVRSAAVLLEQGFLIDVFAAQTFFVLEVFMRSAPEIVLDEKLQRRSGLVSDMIIACRRQVCSSSLSEVNFATTVVLNLLMYVHLCLSHSVIRLLNENVSGDF